jgi:hypothetical protein
VLSAETIQGIKTNYARFVEMIESAEPLYLPYEQNNFDVLRKKAFELGVSDELLAQPNGEHLFSAAFVALKATGKLMFAPNAEQRAEEERLRVRELESRDREGGSRAANAPWLAGEEDPGQSAGRLAVEAGKRYRTEAEQRKTEQAAEAARIASESDLSRVPSLKSIIDANGAEIPVAEQKAMSRIQHREYCRRLSNARNQLLARGKRAGIIR